jgi:hypothetical protein
MNSQSTNMSFRRSNTLRWTMNLLLLPAVVTGIAQAQNNWLIDPNDSIATLSLGSEVNALQIGVARVSGQVVFEASDPSDPTVSLKINSGNEAEAEYATMSFVSHRCARRSDRKLVIDGDLSVTRVERSVTSDANEAYAGPQYGEPVAYTDTRPITLVFSDPRGIAPQGSMMQLSGTSTVVREDFPQALDAIALDDWPSQLINGEKCVNPSTIGEDYHGAECTGTVVASVHNAVIPTGASSGEGFYGFVPVVTPDRDKGTIALQLALRQGSPSNIASR